MSKTISKTAKAQIAVEFFLYVSVFLLVFLIAFALLRAIQASDIPPQEARLAQQEGERIAEAIRLSARAGAGFQYNLTFPTSLLGRPYKVAVTKDNMGLVLTWETSGGEVNFFYAIPPYSYDWAGCRENDENTLYSNSNKCENILSLTNDGTTLTVKHVSTEGGTA